MYCMLDGSYTLKCSCLLHRLSKEDKSNFMVYRGNAQLN